MKFWFFAALFAAVLAAEAYAKPKPPVSLVGEVVAFNADTKTATIELSATSAVKGETVNVTYKLPKNTDIVAGSETRVRIEGGEKVTFQYQAAKEGEELTIKVHVKGEKINLSANVKLKLAPPEEPEPPVSVQTDKGEKLRLHRNK